jgi:hypothetical protein
MRSNLVICLSVIFLLSALMAGCDIGGGLSVPVSIENADDVGALGFNLLYDSTVFEVTRVDLGTLAKGSVAQWALQKPGELLVLVSYAHIDGNGTLVEVKCKVLNSTGTSTLAIQVLEARSASTSELVETEVSEGSFSASDMSVKAPVIRFGS